MNDHTFHEIMGPARGVEGMNAKEGGSVRSSPHPSPPTSLFANSTSGRWNGCEPDSSESIAATARAVAAAAESAALRESLISDFNEVKRTNSMRTSASDEQNDLLRNSEGIRQEALRMLEVADEALSGSSYTVHRTTTGGFTATPRSNGKRVPTALSGMGQYTSMRKSNAKRYSDSDINITPAVVTPSRDASKSYEEFEYGDESVVDVVGMETRFASSRVADEKPKNWSSRYSIDHVQLALAGGSVSNSTKFLDGLDREHRMKERERKSALNIFTGGEARPKIFGNGFSFRDKSVFGRQNVTISPPEKDNLMVIDGDDDDEPGASLPPAPPVKSWQERMETQAKQRRRYSILCLVACILIVGIVLFTVGREKVMPSASSSSSQDAAMTSGVSFYVVSDVPFHENDEQTFTANLANLGTSSNFLVHLGNIQNSAVTGCHESIYKHVAWLLKKSPIPVFVIPGANDWTNCPDAFAAFGNWLGSFRFFEANFKLKVEILRDTTRQANFAFVDSGVLFIGVNVVGGNVRDWDETLARNKDNAAWVQDMVQEETAKYTGSKAVRAVVVFGNARPGLPQNANFFKSLNTVASGLKNNTPLTYIYSGTNQTGTVQSQAGLNSVKVIEALGGPTPVRITVGFGDNPFVLG